MPFYHSLKSSAFDLSSLPTDPGLRPRILDYSHDVWDKIRRAYLQKGPCQPRGHEFPFKPTESGKGQMFAPATFSLNYLLPATDWGMLITF